MSELNQSNNPKKTDSTSPQADSDSAQSAVNPRKLPNFGGEQFSRLGMFRRAEISDDTKPEEPQA